MHACEIAAEAGCAVQLTFSPETPKLQTTCKEDAQRATTHDHIKPQSLVEWCLNLLHKVWTRPLGFPFLHGTWQVTMTERSNKCWLCANGETKGQGQVCSNRGKNSHLLTFYFGPCSISTLQRCICWVAASATSCNCTGACHMQLAKLSKQIACNGNHQVCLCTRASSTCISLCSAEHLLSDSPLCPARITGMRLRVLVRGGHTSRTLLCCTRSGRFEFSVNGPAHGVERARARSARGSLLVPSERRAGAGTVELCSFAQYCCFWQQRTGHCCARQDQYHYFTCRCARAAVIASKNSSVYDAIYVKLRLLSESRGNP